jgi:hypothetical protein
MQAKIKYSKTIKKSKGCACETPLAEVFFLPGNGAKKQLDADGVDI